MLSKMITRRRDFVFVIDLFSPVHFFVQQKMKDTIGQIFDNHVEGSDRVSLVRFSSEKFVRRIFSLVRKDKNLTQTKNQFISKVWDKDMNQSSEKQRNDPDIPLRQSSGHQMYSEDKHQEMFAKAIRSCLEEFDQSSSKTRKWLIYFSP